MLKGGPHLFPQESRSRDNNAAVNRSAERLEKGRFVPKGCQGRFFQWR